MTSVAGVSPDEIFEREQGVALARRTRVALVVTIAIHLVNLPTNDAELVGLARAAWLRGAMILLCCAGLVLLRPPLRRRSVERVAGPIWMTQLVGLGVLQWLSPDESLEAWSGVFLFGPMVLALASGFSVPLTMLLVSSGHVSQLVILLVRLGHVSDVPLQLPVLIAIVAAARSRDSVARAEVESRSALLALHEQHLHAQRAHILSELHDGPAASVARAAVLADRASTEGRAEEALAAARHGLAEALAEARALMSELEQPFESWAELVAELRREHAEACERAGVASLFVASADRDSPPAASLAHALRRALREATTNAIRHARPSEIACRLTRSEGLVTLEVRDDGRAVPGARGRGLSILVGRAKRHGGDAHLSRTESGTVLEATYREQDPAPAEARTS